MKKPILLFLLLCSTSLSAQISTQLVYDFQSGSGSSNPTYLAAYNNKLYFFANDGTNGSELWSYDGVNTPTMTYNLNPGVSSAGTGTTNQHMALLNGKLYFPANNGTTGVELYMYDGTNPPTLAVDIESGSGSSTPSYLTVLGGKLYFHASTAANGAELYIYDGTNPPTRIDINPGAASSSPSELIAYNGKLYFSATSAANGTELYSYDPSTNATTMVQDIASGAASSTPVNLVEINSKLYFSASTSTYGRELYSYDGSSVLRVTDVASGAGNGVYPSTANVIMGLNNVVYFSGSSTGTGYQLYKFDPSTGNATLVYNINPGGDAAPSNFVVYKGNLYFSAFTSTAGREIWWFDGTTTNMVTDLNPGIGNSAATDFYVWANNLYFNASNGTSGFELFRINDPTSVKNVAFGGQLSVFPNPAPGDVTLDLSLDKAEALRISVHDIQGRIVWEKAQTRYNAGTTKIVLPATRFAAGTYCYLLQNADGRQAISGSFIKE